VRPPQTLAAPRNRALTRLERPTKSVMHSGYNLRVLLSSICVSRLHDFRDLLI